MRKIIISAVSGLAGLYAGAASADFYVVQNTQTGQRLIADELPSNAGTQILLNNKFNERKDAELALNDVPACN